MALGVSRGDLSVLASGFCAVHFGAVGAPGDMGMAVVAHDDLFCDDELDLFDRVGQRAAGQCDLATESSAGLGDVGDGLLVSRADAQKRLVDVGMVHRRGVVSFGHGDELCTVESIGSVVVALVGSSQRCALCGGDIVLAIVEAFGFGLAHRVEPSGDCFGDVSVGLEFWSGVSLWMDVAAFDWDRGLADGDALLAFCAGLANDPESHREFDYTFRAGVIAGVGALGASWGSGLSGSELVDLGRWVDDSRGLRHKVFSSSWSRRS